MSNVSKDKQQFAIEAFRYLMFESGMNVGKSEAKSIWDMLYGFCTVDPQSQNYWYESITHTTGYKYLKQGRPDLAEPIAEWHKAIKDNIKARKAARQVELLLPRKIA